MLHGRTNEFETHSSQVEMIRIWAVFQENGTYVHVNKKKSPGGETEIWGILHRRELEILYIYISAFHYAKYNKRTE